MALAAPTFSQIKAQVAAIRQKTSEATVIGIRAQGRWTGDRYQQDGNETYLIEQCDSPLAMRIALREQPDNQAIKVLITSLDDTQLEEDILIRLAKRRLFPIDSWQIAKSLFQAYSVDPRLVQHRWIADYLLEHVPPEGYSPVSGGFLDAETVWSILLQRGLGFATHRPDLIEILQWSADPDNINRYQSTPTAFQSAAVDWMVETAGTPAKTILRCVALNDRPDTLPLGLVCEVLFHPDIQGQLDKAIGKLEERFLDGMALDEGAISRWKSAAITAIQSPQLTPKQKQQFLKRADEILQDIGAESFAYLSTTTPLGFNQRLTRFGKQLAKLLNAPKAEALEALAIAYQSIKDHNQTRLPENQHRLESTKMALRLARWLTQTKPDQLDKPKSLEEAVQYHVTEGCFLDWARLSLKDPIHELSAAYKRLFDRITDLREQHAYEFAKLLQDWTAVGSSRPTPIPVENILDAIVAPLAAHSRVLLIVMDGMSLSVCRELLTDIRRQDWALLTQENQPSSILAGLATIPSVTEASRMSLLTGQLQSGVMKDEKKGFSAHPGLLKHCRKNAPPLLFHKASLQNEEDAVLSNEVREAIQSTQNQVIGVVVNAIDDQLSKGDQLDMHWSCDRIKVLPALLYEARNSDRLVILTSDHGHVLEQETTYQSSEGGERWRLDDAQPTPKELQISGSRVVIPDSKTLIAPWTEKLRYKPKKNGYHGGLTPQEMIVPIAVLCSSHAYPSAWDEAAIDTPTWWDETIKVVESSTPYSVTPQAQSNEYAGFGPLFDTPETPNQTSSEQSLPDWITSLLASPVFEQQKQLLGRLVPNNEMFVQVLVALDHQGGTISLTALARSLNLAITPTRDLITVVQRILNVDGYIVLSLNQDLNTLELNHDLLQQQFA